MKKAVFTLFLVCGLNATAQANSLALGFHTPVTVIETRAQSMLAQEQQAQAKQQMEKQKQSSQDGMSKVFKQLKAYLAKTISE